MFEVEKPVSKTGIGVDQLPESVRLSSVLTGNNLGQLGNLEYLPTERENKSYINENELEHLVNGNSKEQLHATAQDYIEKNELEKALHILLAKQ
jgi:hypothetical protein